MPPARRRRLQDGPGYTRPKPAEQAQLPFTRQEEEQWADNLPTNYLFCRSKKHNLKDIDTWPVGRSGAGTLWRCVSCRLEITEIIDGRGFVVESKPNYPPGYLAPKGAGRATKERNGMLRVRRAQQAIARKAAKK